MHTGEVIKHIRKQKNLTQQELADILGVQKSSVQKYENGSVQNLKLETLQKLCKEFRTAPYAFVFPQVWEEIKFGAEDTDLDHQVMMVYINLTDKAKEKVLDYMMDLGEIEKYKKPKQITLKAHWLHSETEE